MLLSFILFQCLTLNWIVLSPCSAFLCWKKASQFSVCTSDPSSLLSAALDLKGRRHDDNDVCVVFRPSVVDPSLTRRGFLRSPRLLQRAIDGIQELQAAGCKVLDVLKFWRFVQPYSIHFIPPWQNTATSQTLSQNQPRTGGQWLLPQIHGFAMYLPWKILRKFQ